MKPHKLQAEFDAIQAARTVASETAQALINSNPGVWYPCGFAWVMIKPARGPLIEALKDRKLGRTSESGGFQVYNPSGNPTQWMDAKVDGATAFKNSLELFLQKQATTYPKYKITLESRID